MNKGSGEALRRYYERNPKEVYEPTPAEIREACRRIREAKGHVELRDEPDVWTAPEIVLGPQRREEPDGEV